MSKMDRRVIIKLSFIIPLSVSFKRLSFKSGTTLDAVVQMMDENEDNNQLLEIFSLIQFLHKKAELIMRSFLFKMMVGINIKFNQ